MISTKVDLYFPLLRLGNLHLKQRKIIQINLGRNLIHFNLQHVYILCMSRWSKKNRFLKDGLSIAIQGYFCAVYDYAEKVDRGKCHWKLSKKKIGGNCSSRKRCDSFLIIRAVKAVGSRGVSSAQKFLNCNSCSAIL